MFNYRYQNKLIYRFKMHSCKQKNYVSLAKEFQRYLSKDHCNHEVIDPRK